MYSFPSIPKRTILTNKARKRRAKLHFLIFEVLCIFILSIEIDEENNVVLSVVFMVYVVVVVIVSHCGLLLLTSPSP